MDATEYLRRGLQNLEGFELPYAAPVFNELVLRSKGPRAASLVTKLAEQGIIAGVDLGRFRNEWSHDLLIAVTELHTKDDLDRLLEALAS